jgi:hypothetical protein
VVLNGPQLQYEVQYVLKSEDEWRRANTGGDGYDMPFAPVFMREPRAIRTQKRRALRIGGIGISHGASGKPPRPTPGPGFIEGFEPSSLQAGLVVAV